MLFNFGLKIRTTNDKVYPTEVSKILEEIKGKEEEKVVSTLILRTLKVAKYESENKGHFGIASKYYCHFTSPIRRYPDLTIHRIIKEYIHKKGALSASRKDELDEFAYEASEQSSACERNADFAERDVDDLWKAYLMKDRVGEVFDATISSVTNFGMFVALDNTVEGLIRLTDMPDDSYLFLEKQLKLKGSKHTFSLGDKVKVELISVNLQARNIDFKLAEE